MSPSRRKNGERDQGRQENLAAAGENCEVYAAPPPIPILKPSQARAREL